MLLCRWLWLVSLSNYRATGFFNSTKEEATRKEPLLHTQKLYCTISLLNYHLLNQMRSLRHH